MQLLKILLIVIFVFLPFGELLRIGVGNDIYVKPMDVMAILLGFYVLLLALLKKMPLKSFSWHYFLFPLIGLISLVINSYWLHPNQWFASVLYLARWVGYLSIFFAIRNTDKLFHTKLLKLILIDGIIVLVIGYTQYFLYPNLRNLIYLGWDDHLYRMFSSFLDPNFAGTFFVLYLILLVGLLFKTVANKKKNSAILLGLLSVVTLVALFLTYSRGALLMLLVSSFTLLVLLQKKKFIFIIIGAIGVFLISISPFFYLENLNFFRIASITARIHTNENAFKVITANPIVGVGFDSYRYAQQRYQLQKGPSKYPSHADAGVDTSLLFVLATTGIVGFAAYTYLWVRLTFQTVAIYKKKKNIFAAVAIASSAGLFVNALFTNSLFFPAVMLWMWFVFAFAEG